MSRATIPFLAAGLVFICFVYVLFERNRRFERNFRLKVTAKEDYTRNNPALQTVANKKAPSLLQPLASKTLGPAGSSSPTDELYRLWNYVYNQQYHCTNSEYFGGRKGDGDGAYDLCLEDRFWPLLKNNSYKCLAYLFGVGGNIMFDDGLAERGCEVHSFDPSVHWKDGMVQKSGVTFHKVGISDADIDNGPHNWKMRTLATLIKELGHSGRYLDYLKIDADASDRGGGYEDVLMKELLDTGLYKCVRQFSMEIHLIGSVLKDKKTLAKCRLIYDQMTQLNEKGWRLYNTTDNVRYVQNSNPSYTQRQGFNSQLKGSGSSMLWELAFVNFNVEAECGKYLQK